MVKKWKGEIVKVIVNFLSLGNIEAERQEAEIDESKNEVLQLYPSDIMGMFNKFMIDKQK